MSLDFINCPMTALGWKQPLNALVLEVSSRPSADISDIDLEVWCTAVWRSWLSHESEAKTDCIHCVGEFGMNAIISIKYDAVTCKH